MTWPSLVTPAAAVNAPGKVLLPLMVTVSRPTFCQTVPAVEPSPMTPLSVISPNPPTEVVPLPVMALLLVAGS